VALDPKRILFGVQLRPLADDEKNEGINCRGCAFERQPAKVCVSACAEAIKRGLRDCDAVDQFGDVAIYVRVEVDPRQLDLVG
jgi:hypothetical protein